MAFMAGMGILPMVTDMEEGIMAVQVTDHQIDQIDQGLNILSQDQTDRQQCRLDQQQDHLWGDLRQCQQDL